MNVSLFNLGPICQYFKVKSRFLMEPPPQKSSINIRSLSPSKNKGMIRRRPLEVSARHLYFYFSLQTLFFELQKNCSISFGELAYWAYMQFVSGRIRWFFADDKVIKIANKRIETRVESKSSKVQMRLHENVGSLLFEIYFLLSPSSLAKINCNLKESQL